jgi:hypothetical protein
MKSKDMKRICFSPLLLLLNGCFSCGTGSHVQEVDPGLKVYRPSVPVLADVHTSARLDLVTPGTWVRYRLSMDGSETTITLGAVRVEEKSLWVEVVEEGDPKKASLRRIGFDGRVTSARFQEIPASGPPSEIADQPVSPGVDPAAASGAPASSKEEKRIDDRLPLGGGDRVPARVFRDESVGRGTRKRRRGRGCPPLLRISRATDRSPAWSIASLRRPR